MTGCPQRVFADETEVGYRATRKVLEIERRRIADGRILANGARLVARKT